MGKSRVIPVVVAVALVATSSALAAGTKVPQSGSVKGDPGTVVKLALVEADGVPRRVKNVRFEQLRMSCSTGSEQVRMKLFGAARVRRSREFANTYRTGKSMVRLEGKVSRRGSSVRGSIAGTTVRIAGAGRCEVPSVEFTTRG